MGGTATTTSPPATSSKPASGGLKQQWDLKEPNLGTIGSSEQAKKFADTFKAAMAPANDCVKYTVVNAEKSKHDLLVSERDNIYMNFQAAQAKIDPADEAKAKGDIDVVLNTARGFAAKATQVKQATEKSVNAWKAKEPEYDKSVGQVEELEKWKEKSAPDLRKLADSIRSAVNDRKFDDAVKNFAQLSTNIKPLYEEYQKQKTAKDKYDSTRKAMEVDIANVLGPPPDEKTKTLRDSLGKLNTDASAAVEKSNYVGANEALGKMPKIIEDYKAAVKTFSEKQKYDSGLKSEQPRYDEALKLTAPDTLKAKREELVKGSAAMESAAKEGKYDQAVTSLADRTKKVDVYFKEVKASEHKNKAEWAKKRKDEFLKIKDEGRTLKEAVSADNKETIAIFESMNKSFQEFQKRKENAQKRFEARIKEIADKVKMYKEVASAILNQALGALVGLPKAILDAGKAGIEVMGKISLVIGVIDPALAAKAKAAEEATPYDTSKVKLGIDIDLIDHCDKLLTALKRFDATSDTFDKVFKKIDDEIKWLDSVISNPTAADGQDRHMDAIDSATVAQGQFAGINAKSSADLAPMKSAGAELDKMTEQEMEKQFAIRWLASISRTDADMLGPIDQADGYLKELGIIDTKNNTLGVDTGSFTTDRDTTMIRLHAIVESQVQALVGQSLLWMGSNKARSDSGTFTVSGPSSLKDLSAKSSVICTGFTRPQGKTIPEGDNWREAEYLQVRRMAYVLAVTPGGDAYDGPSVRAAN